MKRVIEPELRCSAGAPKWATQAAALEGLGNEAAPGDVNAKVGELERVVGNLHEHLPMEGGPRVLLQQRRHHLDKVDRADEAARMHHARVAQMDVIRRAHVLAIVSAAATHGWLEY